MCSAWRWPGSRSRRLAVVDAVEQALEECSAVLLVLGSGVVVLGLQGGQNSMPVWKNVQFSQMDSKAQSSSGGRVQ